MISQKNNSNNNNNNNNNQFQQHWEHYFGYARSSLFSLNKSALLAASNMGKYSRFLAYTSEVGEAGRPVVHHNLVRSAYVVSWAYVCYDVHNYYNYSYEHGKRDYQLYKAAAQRTVFQSIASMFLPAIAVHQTVHFSGKGFALMQARNMIKNKKFLIWGPTVTGLCVIPFLPYLFDEPIEHGVEWMFNKF
jgi:mitochondrial fission process protein 1